MRLNEDHDLAPSTIELLRASLGPKAEAPSVTDEDLVSFMLGADAPSERERVMTSLVLSQSLRERMAEFDRDLRSVENASLADISDNETIHASLRQGLSAFLSSALDFYSGIQGWLSEHGWDAMRTRAEQSSVASSYLGSVGSSLRRLNRLPAFAATRSAIILPSARSLPEGAILNFLALIDEAGDLQVSATVQDKDIEVITLFLEDPAGGQVPLASSSVQEGRWSVRLEGFGLEFGMDPGLVPASSFSLSRDASPQPPELRLLLVESEAGPIPLAMVEPPAFEAEKLTLRIDFRDALVPTHVGRSLCLTMNVGNLTLTLGRYAIKPSDTGVKDVQFDVPGAPDGVLDAPSILLARIE